MRAPLLVYFMCGNSYSQFLWCVYLSLSAVDNYRTHVLLVLDVSFLSFRKTSNKVRLT